MSDKQIGIYQHLLQTIPVLSWGQSGRFFEEFSEDRLGGEMERIGYLLDRKVCTKKHCPGLKGHIVKNDFLCRPSRFLFDQPGEIL